MMITPRTFDNSILTFQSNVSIAEVGEKEEGGVMVRSLAAGLF